jgi:hypothetical protein
MQVSCTATIKLAIMSVGFCAAFGTCAIADDDPAVAPDAGTYNAQIYVQSADAGCLDKAGYVFIGEASFAGLGGATHALRFPETGSNIAFVSSQTLAVTTGKGTTQLGGNLTWNGAGIGGNWNYTGTFSAKIIENGTHAFVIELKESYTGCTAEDSNIALVRTGGNQ